MLSLHGDAVENSCFFELWLLIRPQTFYYKKGPKALYPCQNVNV